MFKSKLSSFVRELSRGQRSELDRALAIALEIRIR
jgi:hypothetical protein